jgi:hypothetical protein
VLQVYESSAKKEESISSKGTTIKEAATSSTDCVAVRNQLFADAGTSFALDDLAPWTNLGSGMTMTQVRTAACRAAKLLCWQCFEVAIAQHSVSTVSYACVTPVGGHKPCSKHHETQLASVFLSC